MKPHLILSTAIKTALENAALVSATYYAHGDTTAKATPLVSATVADCSSPHPKMHRGNLILRFEYDADALTAEDASAAMDTLTAWLAGAEGTYTVRGLLADEEAWLRILGPVSKFDFVPAGERGKAIETTLPYWIQTAF